MVQDSGKQRQNVLDCPGYSTSADAPRHRIRRHKTMREAIPVRVTGPALLRRAFCCLLSTFPDLLPSEGTTIATDPPPSVDSPVRLIITAAASDPYVLLPDVPYRIALLTAGTEAELNAACTTGVQVLLSIDDDPRTLHHGISATRQGNAFCSPALAPNLMRTLHQRAVWEVRKREEEEMREKLSARECEVAQLAASGLSNKEVSERLCLGLSTVKAHLGKVYKKLDIQRRGQINVVFRQSDHT